MITQRLRNPQVRILLILLAMISVAAATMFRGQPTMKGKSYGEWSAVWMAWLEATDFAPLFEEGDVDCSVGQSGSVWFLAGTGGGAATRNCTIPTGKVLMFPLLNVWWSNSPGENLTVAEKRIILDELLNDTAPGLLNSKVCQLHSSVNGEPSLYSVYAQARTQSPPFDFQGDRRAIVDGYWVMLNLPEGAHTLQFGGGLCDFDSGDLIFDVDVTYNLTVE